MKAIACILFTLFLFSCGKQSAISKKLSGSDSLVITFNAPNSDSILSMVTTTEKKAIRKLSGFLNGKATEPKDCGYDGNMVFYQNGSEVLPVIFTYSIDSCHRFLFGLDNKTMSTKMSKEAADFLKSLAEGRGWY